MRFMRDRSFRSPQALWCASAVVASVAASFSMTSGRGAMAVVLAVWAIVSLYGSVDHVVEPALAELLEEAAPEPRRRPALVDRSRPPAELSARQRRVLRLLAYGLPDDEIAEMVDVDEPEVASDVRVILAHLGVEDRAEAIEVTHRTGIVVAAGPRPAA